MSKISIRSLLNLREVPTTAGLLAISVLLLAVGWLPTSRPTAGPWLIAAGALLAAGVFLATARRDAGLWWLVPAAAVLLGLGLVIVLASWLPGDRLLVGGGITLLAAGLGVVLVYNRAGTPASLLAAGAGLLYIGIALLEFGLGYRPWTIALALITAGFSCAVAAFYTYDRIFLPLAALVCLAGIALSPIPSAALRLVLPTLLLWLGLALLHKSARQPNP